MGKAARLPRYSPDDDDDGAGDDEEDKEVICIADDLPPEELGRPRDVG